jgi:hypothetical protein
MSGDAVVIAMKSIDGRMREEIFERVHAGDAGHGGGVASGLRGLT